MAATSLQNVWHVRTVAEASAKSCYVCYKPTSKVLITPDSKVGGIPLFSRSHGVQQDTQDFFYICASHLSDRGFASPIIDAEAEAARLKKEAMDKEIEKVKAEYEEKRKKKKGKKKEKDAKEKEKTQDDDDEKERDEKVGKPEALQAPLTHHCRSSPSQGKLKTRSSKMKFLGTILSTSSTVPRSITYVHPTDTHTRTFYQMRVDRLRNIEMTKRNQERLRNPSSFPSVPKNDLP